LDKLRGEIKYEYEANGQLRSRDTGSLVGSEEFRYNSAANRLDFNARQFAKVKDNRIKQWRDQEYRYDPWGNLIEKRSGHSKLQSFSYDCENRLVRAETLVNGKLASRGEYRYDSLGRRIAKQAEINGEVEQKRFLWQGLRMLREETPTQSILYLYEPGSYAPLARVDQVEGEGQKVYYFHTDQIGAPLELTDSDGKIVWQATYRSWGAIENLAVNQVEQNLRFPGQYFDSEAGLHYNTFRFYDAELGRFLSQDPIGLAGGVNVYLYAENPVQQIDPLGWCSTKLGNSMGAKKGDGMANHHLIPEEVLNSPQFARMFDKLKTMGFNGDGAPNGIFLPGSQTLTQRINLPGHWSNHAKYTAIIEGKVSKLNSYFEAGAITDTQLALGIGKIQRFAREGLEANKFIVDAVTGRLL
jgi:RHS repeat-associated protein